MGYLIAPRISYVMTTMTVTCMSQAIMEHFCIMAYMTSNRSLSGEERSGRRSIDSDMPPVKSTRALLVCPPIPMLSQPPFNLSSTHGNAHNFFTLSAFGKFYDIIGLETHSVVICERQIYCWQHGAVVGKRRLRYEQNYSTLGLVKSKKR